MILYRIFFKKSDAHFAGSDGTVSVIAKRMMAAVHAMLLFYEFSNDKFSIDILRYRRIAERPAEFPPILHMLVVLHGRAPICSSFSSLARRFRIIAIEGS